METTKNVIILGDLKEDLKNRIYHHLSVVLVVNSLRNTIKILDTIIIPDDMAFLDSGTITIPDWVSYKATYIRPVVKSI